ncbi:MAG: U32 family peptidase [Lachnoclostridium sp.]|nr:U32 family peptidase [Lachnoclostridium sp.]
MPRKIEILAPARDVEVARKAILCGADAVYIGSESHGARQAAANSIREIAGLCEFAHRFGVKVYVTVNTLVYDDEIAAVEQLIRRLYRAGVDALIVQDMGILRMNIPKIDLHASTQCDIRDVAKAEFLSKVGFTRLVLARELTISEIKEIYDATGCELEAFVHGALCVSYSGDCRASYMMTGRSANRGECAQICRLRYELIDEDGNALAPSAHYLSLRDLNRIDDLDAMLRAGVTSLKIEGRLKDEKYVMNAVAAYRRRVDEIIAAGDGEYVRASLGNVEPGFSPSLEKGFNRGFTSYFLSRPSAGLKMASTGTPKMTGTQVATVVAVTPRGIRVNASERIANGDGLGYFDRAGVFTGFRVNRAEGNMIFPATKVSVSRGTLLYRNRDKAFDDMIDSARPSRQIDVDMKLSLTEDGALSLTISEKGGCSATAVMRIEQTAPSRSPQEEQRRRVLEKLGDTVYKLVGLEDNVGETFVPASVLSNLRREAVEALEQTKRATYPYRYRNKEDVAVKYPRQSIDFHENVANHLAAEFYADHGVTVIEPAMEVKMPKRDEHEVMCTRYCLRRELGCCLKTPTHDRLPRKLYLRSGDIKLRLDFDCAACRMRVMMSKEVVK